METGFSDPPADCSCTSDMGGASRVPRVPEVFSVSDLGHFHSRDGVDHPQNPFRVLEGLES